ncbi:hypothetical protein RvY_04614-1 [Ramazzottius varieornatus]|uniref:Uncharacterized protein n=1 Tax=Ramazzottius varieornatus TaxID=947166 RepID=A0A1D1UYX2_RAMVA|nr:hypothetical protein RvY_04614-1 [Ramazzottius varieornatus]
MLAHCVHGEYTKTVSTIAGQMVGAICETENRIIEPSIYFEPVIAPPIPLGEVQNVAGRQRFTLRSEHTKEAQVIAGKMD